MSNDIYQPNKRIPDENTLKKFRNEFYIDQYGDLRNKIDRGPGHGKDQLAGIIQNNYLVASVNGKQWLTHCILDYLDNNNWYNHIIDHTDRNPLHCNIHNLKRSDFQDNCKNRKRSLRNTSTQTGIEIRKDRNSLVCKLTINKKLLEQHFPYLSKSRKRLQRRIYYWSSYESAWEAAQLFNWLIRKQNGYSVE